jgi:hypothetical protein
MTPHFHYHDTTTIQEVRFCYNEIYGKTTVDHL